MRFGRFNKFLLIIFLTFFTSLSFSEEKIISVPLINLDNLEPSFEEENSENNLLLNDEKIVFKKKEIKKDEDKKTKVNIVALDKITAKTLDFTIRLGEVKKFGMLEIKALQCGNVESQTEPGQAAYIQVKDLSDNNSKQVFVFNGWTFSSSTTIRPLDHPIYDFWLVSCENV
jgi:hypothetical protein